MSGTEIDIEWVRQIANETSGKIAADAQTNTNEFRNSSFDSSAVGTLPVSQAYANQVEAAHTFFTETISNVIADLNDFAANLKTSADAHETNDGNAAAALNAFDVEYQQQDATDYHSHESNQESASDEDLQVSEEAQQAAAAEQDSGATAPGADGSAPAPGDQSSGGAGSGYGSGTGSGSGYGAQP